MTKGLLAATVVAVVIIYGRALEFPFTNFDDHEYIRDNVHVTSGLTLENVRWAFTSVHAGYWHPLTWVSHQLDVSLFGVHAGRMRIASVLLHCASAVVLFLFLARATGRPGPSAAAAALFALHPLRVESVVWVAERKDTLSTFFFVLSLLLYARWVEERRPLRYAALMASFACGLLSKPMVVTLPFVLILVDLWPLGRAPREVFTRGLAEKVPLFAMIVPAIVTTLRTQSIAIGEIPFATRLANALLSWVSYVGKTLWPASLSVFYPYRDNVSAAVAAGATGLLLSITVAAFVLRRRRPYLLLGWLWFLGTTVPIIGIVQAGRQAMADRFTYIPSIGLIVAAVWLVADLLPRSVARAIAALACVGLAIGSYAQVGHWRDTVTLFRHAVDVAGDNTEARLVLGREHLDRGEYSEAAQQFSAALTIDAQNAEAHHLMGATLSAQGDVAGAEASFRRAVQIQPARAAFLRDLGELLLQTGRPEAALPVYERAAAIEEEPVTMATLAAMRGNIDEAIRWYEKAVEKHPHAADLRNNLAAMLARAGRDDEAIGEYEEAIRLSRRAYESRMNLGTLLSRNGRIDEAIDQYVLAMRDAPSSPEPHVFLAIAYGRKRDYAAALASAEAAMQLDEAAANALITEALGIEPAPDNLRSYAESLRLSASPRAN